MRLTRSQRKRTGGKPVRTANMAFVAAVTLATAMSSVSASPILNTRVEQDPAIMQILGGCGPGWHPSRSGRCVPNHHSYYRPYRYGYYGGGHEPWNRPSPGDYGAADQLNRQQLGWHW
jgi:hypothetical protein